MRHAKHFSTPADLAREVFATQPVFRLAGVGRGGQPILRSLHGVVLGRSLYWHGAPAGEGEELEGCEVAVGAEELVAEIPSHFTDAESACPATTLYRSAQARGRVEFVHEPNEKAEALQALMLKLQPEGGYRKITAADPLYRAAVKGIRIAKLPLDDITGKFKLAQNKSPEVLGQLLDGLWRRGRPQDLRAIDRLAETRGDSELPTWLRMPEGLRAQVAPREDFAEQVAELLVDAYWTQGLALQTLQRAQVHSAAWVVLLDEQRQVVASARAVSDHARFASLFDVIVRPERRGQGLGAALVRLILDHPALRAVQEVSLRTRDAQTFYRSLGFELAPSEGEALEFTTSRMIRASKLKPVTP